MAHLIPLSRLARLIGQPRSVLQKMAQSGQLATFDGHIDLDEALRLFPDAKIEDETEIRRVEEIKEQALAKAPARLELPEPDVLQQRLRQLGRDYAAARGKLMHYDRVVGWIGGKLAEAEENGRTEPGFADTFVHWLMGELTTTPSDMARWEAFLARERIMRMMTAQVTLLPKGQTFEIVGSESLLEAGLRAGMAMPYGCSNGSCGDCKCRVASGEVVKVRPHDYMLSTLEKRQGYTLACAYTAVGDVSLEVELDDADDIPEQTINARVREVERLGGRRVAVHLLTSRAERMRYLAGQLLEITVDGQSRRVPAASCPCDERRIEVHVQCETDADAATGPFSSLLPNVEVTVRGPFGRFGLDDASQRPVVLVAEGAGFAQIKSMLQHALSLEHAPSISLVRLASEEGLYQENLLKSYANALDNFQYVAFKAGTPHAAIGDAILEQAGELAQCDVYVAGSEAFTASIGARCRAAGLPEEQLKAEVVA
ncbi:MAG: 2Fe-2S iron-sulfur cluster binding domain-containing protein [Hyphomicrobiaceae bacterium]|nr:2Fe-2S iron-sulfur cluster binding domain-containing protein [Hyphomicrobiaceae bacterium]MCC0007194.1 2Fe-2S iron-sulfur cluster binding domain-containing protein [Hyphomicrobiaceae bacterium]